MRNINKQCIICNSGKAVHAYIRDREYKPGTANIDVSLAKVKMRGAAVTSAALHKQLRESAHL